MTGTVIKSVVIPATPLRHEDHLAGAPSGSSAARRTLPLPTVQMSRMSSVVYGLAAVDVTKQGHLRLPATVRRCCGLIPGDRVLLAADPVRDLLIVYPPALDNLLAQRHAGLLDGDLA